MNTYLLKVAEIVVNRDSSLPYRRRVEVAIFKNGKVLLTKNKGDDGEAWYGFPGGGTEGDRDVDAAHKECLEEVGVAVDQLEPTGETHTQEGIGNKKGRAEKYRGSRTRMFTAAYSGKDDSKLGDDNDAVGYVWKDPDEAEKLLRANKVNSAYRVRAMRAGAKRFTD